jgi:multidrug efflux pump subunit AcrA (membrane-fusion protein)
MLPQDPPPKLVRWIGWLMVVMFFTALTGAIVVHVPETVRSPFVLVPIGGADPIQAPRLAVVTQVHVTEGQRVAAGTELFVLRSDEIRTWRTELTTATSDLRTKAASIVKTEASYADQLNIKKSEIAQAVRELEFRQQTVGTKRDLLARTTALANAKIVPQATLIAEQLDLDQAEKELTLAERRREATDLERQRTETEHAVWRTEANAELEKLKARIAALKAPLNDSRDDLLSIRAPYDGVVISLMQRNAGNVVQAGQELCRIAPLDATPRARVMLQEQGLPRLAVGQRVRLFFEAFPYQRYGSITGTLDWISPAAVASPEGQSFIALASPSQTFILVKQEPRPLQVGMKGEARIIVGDRRLIEYAFEPIRQLRENMRR